MSNINDICNKIDFLVGNKDILANVENVPSLECFSEKIISFLDDLSKVLRKDVRTKEFIDIQSYSFWIRRASVEKEKKSHSFERKRVGRGVAFHIAPSNVPINFAVSMTSSLLAGNACVIRVSNKQFEQVTIICDCINSLLKEKYTELKNYFVIIRYDHDDIITEKLSSICDVRIIWGGNETIRRIRQAQLPARAIEMAFADRYSIAIIDADKYLQADAIQVAKDFYTDTYYSDQNACSSPRLVAWIGDDGIVHKAQKLFWEELHKLVKDRYELHEVQVVDKLDAFCRLAVNGKKLSPTLQLKLKQKDNYLHRVEINELNGNILQYKESSGYFFEYRLEQLEDISCIMKKSCQTVAVLGIEKEQIKKIVLESGVRGVDRVVEIGKTMELSFIWDGYDMIETMSRIVNV